MTKNFFFKIEIEKNGGNSLNGVPYSCLITAYLKKLTKFIGKQLQHCSSQVFPNDFWKNFLKIYSVENLRAIFQPHAPLFMSILHFYIPRLFNLSGDIEIEYCRKMG